MVVAEALEVIGAPGWIVILAMVGLGLYHFTNLLAVFSQVGTILKVVAGVIAVGTVATLGLIPGIEVDVKVVPDTIAEVANGIWQLLTDALSIVGVVG